MPKSASRIHVAISPKLFETLFIPETARALHDLGSVTLQPEEHVRPEDLARRISNSDILITGWGTPRFTPELVAAAGHLQLVAHSAASVRRLEPARLLEKGVVLTHAAAALAPAVADLSLLMTMLLLRQAHRRDRRLRAGDWEAADALPMGEEISGQRVGVVGASHTGRSFIKLLRALEVDVWVYDPYLTEARAGELGVTKVDLAQLLSQCRIVSIHAPSTAETHHMIGAHELALLPDGAMLVNTARAWVVDQEALLAELQSGRIQAALDVFDQEPLPRDHPFLALDNVFLTPHIAGASIQARHRQGRLIVEEIRRFLAGEPLRYQLTAQMLDRMG